ncbi:MAG: hypothetical protein O2954_08725 [bacterium]|nr:hypothetical protein [bacterium]
MNRLNEILDLYNQAARLAEKVGSQLQAGASPDGLISFLREQADTIGQLQTSLAELAAGEPPDASNQQKIEQLKTDFETLVKQTEENYRMAAKKGVRLTGIGGKPYRRRP